MASSRYILTIPDAHLPTPRDPGIKPGGIRERALRAAKADMSKVNAELAYRRQRTAEGDAERLARIAEALRLQKELG